MRRENHVIFKKLCYDFFNLLILNFEYFVFKNLCFFSCFSFFYTFNFWESFEERCFVLLFLCFRWSYAFSLSLFLPSYVNVCYVLMTFMFWTLLKENDSGKFKTKRNNFRRKQRRIVPHSSVCSMFFVHSEQN